MVVKRVTLEYLEQAVALAENEYNKECSYIPELYPRDYSKQMREFLSPIFERGDGVVCCKEDILLGYLVQGFEWKNGNVNMIYCPLVCYGVTDGVDRKKVMSFMFQQFAKDRMAGDPVHFEMSVYAHDKEIMEYYIMTQFGIQCSEGIRLTKGTINLTRNTINHSKKDENTSNLDNITYRELSKKTIQKTKSEILNLYHRLVEHLQQSPVFYPGKEFTDEMYTEFIMDENTHMYGAFHEDELIGIMDSNFDDHSFITSESDTMNVGDIYVKEEYRGKQVAAGLLTYVNDIMSANGTNRLWVMHGTANPNARAFWDRYFQPFTYTLIRDILPF